jgi:hypothetical protein
LMSSATGWVSGRLIAFGEAGSGRRTLDDLQLWVYWCHGYG